MAGWRGASATSSAQAGETVLGGRADARGGGEPRSEGTPQGGPLSPLLSNILLTDWDRELEARGLAFVRYADDCNIYVGSEAATNAMGKLTVWLKEHLKLAVNEAKSAVARPWERKFLGYGLTGRAS